jgi:hypothetical protein
LTSKLSAHYKLSIIFFCFCLISVLFKIISQNKDINRGFFMSVTINRFQDLPTELHGHIASYLSLEDQFALGGVNSSLYGSFREIRIGRVAGTIIKNITTMNMPWLEAKRMSFGIPTVGHVVTEALAFLEDLERIFSESNRGAGIEEASAFGHSIPRNSLAMALAADDGRWDVVWRLLDIDTISIWGRGCVVGAASTAGQLDVVQVLLASGSIPKTFRSMAVWAASTAGHSKIVQVLLASGPIIEPWRGYTQGIARIAEENGHSDIAEMLRQSRYSDIFLDQFEEELEGEAAEQTSRSSVTRKAIVATACSIAVGILACYIQRYTEAQFFEDL